MRYKVVASCLGLCEIQKVFLDVKLWNFSKWYVSSSLRYHFPCNLSILDNYIKIKKWNMFLSLKKSITIDQWFNCSLKYIYKIKKRNYYSFNHIISNYLIQQFNVNIKLFQRDDPSQGDSLLATFFIAFLYYRVSFYFLYFFRLLIRLCRFRSLSIACR